MTRSSIGLALLMLIPAFSAAAQPRQPRPRTPDSTVETPPASTAETSTPSTAESTPVTTTSDVNPYAAGIAPAPAPVSGRASRLHVHDVGVGYRGTFASSQNGTRALLHGPSIAYSYYVGRRWGFMLHGEASFPIVGHAGGTGGQYDSVLTTDYDQGRYSFDGSFMIARRMNLSDALVFTAGVGLHFQSFALKSVTRLPVEAITGGVAGFGKLDVLLSDSFSLGVSLSSGADFLDFVQHTNRVTLVVPFSATVGIGLRY